MRTPFSSLLTPMWVSSCLQMSTRRLAMVRSFLPFQAMRWGTVLGFSHRSVRQPRLRLWVLRVEDCWERKGIKNQWNWLLLYNNNNNNNFYLYSAFHKTFISTKYIYIYIYKNSWKCLQYKFNFSQGSFLKQVTMSYGGNRLKLGSFYTSFRVEICWAWTYLLFFFSVATHEFSFTAIFCLDDELWTWTK